MEETPLVSIGIAAYNRPESLEKVLSSICSQTYGNLEIIVSDDCSPKKEVSEVVRNAMKTEPRIRFYRQNHNLGAIGNMEFVLKESTGKYFLWADDEDLCEPCFVERLVTLMEVSPEVVACASDVRIIDFQDNLVRIACLESIRPHRDWRRAQKLFFQYPTTHIYLCVLGLFRTSVLKSCNVRNMAGWNGFASNCEVPFLAELSVRGRIVAIPEVLKTYRFNPDSVYHSEQRSIPWFDHFMLRLTIRMRLCRIALSSNEPPMDKAKMIGVVFYSFVVSFIRSILSKLKRLVSVSSAKP